MKRDTSVALRLSGELKSALARAASDDRRSMSAVVEMILTDRLREMGYLSRPTEDLGLDPCLPPPG
jgi:hypothetical protein